MKKEGKAGYHHGDKEESKAGYHHDKKKMDAGHHDKKKMDGGYHDKKKMKAADDPAWHTLSPQKSKL